MRNRARALATSLLLPLCGCSYLENRANDLFDVFSVRVGTGPGLYAGARVTDFTATGLGYRMLRMAGTHGRFGFGDADVSSMAVAILVQDGFQPWDAAPLLGDPSRRDPPAHLGAQYLFFLPRDELHCGTYSIERRGLRVADVNASVAVGWVGLDVGFSPGELLDLLFGLAGIDLAGDDASGADARAENEDDSARAAPAVTSGTPARSSPGSAR